MSAQPVASQIDALAGVLEERAAVLRGYAEALRTEGSFDEQMADEFAGPSKANAIVTEVENRTKALDLWNFRHVLFNALSKAQRSSQEA